MAYFDSARSRFRFSPANWRKPQFGALGSLIAHWSVEPHEPALVALPTGSGKTGVALAAPFITETAPRRVLVLVPSAALRTQTVDQFRSLELLRRIDALRDGRSRRGPKVGAIEGRDVDWSTFDDADVVVAIPQSISPASDSGTRPPPPDLFDLVIVDEAHHAPAATWRAILDHLDFTHALLLTATPFRLDRRPLPGTRTYYYPLRHAIHEHFYKPIKPIVMGPPDPYSEMRKDMLIRDQIVSLLRDGEHSTSVLMVRARTIKRAEALADLYREAGVDIETLHSRVRDQDQDGILRRLSSGDLRAISVVGMLGEGFDLPSLRLVAYHDKHKSMPATIQMIGRLARVDPTHPQDSVLVTVNDAEVYPELVGVVRQLYQEDADWATLLPGIVDTHVEREAANRQFVSALQPTDLDIDPTILRPMPTPTIYELWESWEPPQGTDELPDELREGQEIAGARLLLSRATSDGSTIVLVARRTGSPPWYPDPALESVTHDIHIVSYRAAPTTDLPSLLFVDADDNAIRKALVETLAVPETYRPVSVELLDGYLQSLPRTSVSMIGMRNILAGTRGTSYRTRAGRSTDTDLRSIETTQTALGHIMMVISTPDGSTTVGGAFEKGKVWQRRYKPLVDYADWISEAAELIWYPRTGGSPRLLPQVARGRTLFEFPPEPPIAIELNPAVAVGGYVLTEDGTPIGTLEDVDLHVGTDPIGTLELPDHTSDEVPCLAILHDRENDEDRVCWTGYVHANGSVSSAGSPPIVHRGVVEIGPMHEFLEYYPPTVYFLDGQATHGTEIFDIRGGAVPAVDPRLIVPHDWAAAGTNIRAETRETAQQHEAAGTGHGYSVHEELERFLSAQPRRRRSRWILHNDGSGEIADYIVIEHTSGSPVIVGLWHAKPAGGAPGLRVDDFQVLVAQAIRSRSWFNDPSLWERIRLRLTGREHPPARLAEGSDPVGRLLVLLGEPIGTRGPSRRSWVRRTPVVDGEIAVAQPGLSKTTFEDSLPGTPGETVTSLRQLFSLLSDTVSVTGNLSTILSSP